MSREKQMAAFGRLLDIMDDLREKCPWDREQTIDSLRILTIEETYELAEAITNNDLENLEEELGDLLLHIVFYAKIGSEKKAFDIESVATKVCEKLIRRHPHIYGDVKVDGTDEVLANWEAIKLQERKDANKERKSVLDGVPSALPALPKALRIQQKARKVGFDWDNPQDAWKKVLEEIKELEEADNAGDKVEQTKEFGDVLFALANYARLAELDPEGALEKTNQKFINRFKKMESLADENGQSLTDMTLEEMDKLWDITKITYR